MFWELPDSNIGGEERGYKCLVSCHNFVRQWWINLWIYFKNYYKIKKVNPIPLLHLAKAQISAKTWRFRRGSLPGVGVFVLASEDWPHGLMHMKRCSSTNRVFSALFFEVGPCKVAGASLNSLKYWQTLDLRPSTSASQPRLCHQTGLSLYSLLEQLWASSPISQDLLTLLSSSRGFL